LRKIKLVHKVIYSTLPSFTAIYFMGFFSPTNYSLKTTFSSKDMLTDRKKYTNRQKDRHGHHNTQLPISGRVKSKTIDLMTAKECHNRKKTHK